jgi:hypothetical protein
MSWNLCQSWLWGFDVSGISIDNQLLVMTPTGPWFLSGGEFGLEGSVLSTVAFLALFGWLLRAKPFESTAEVARTWRRYPPGFGCAPPADGAVDDDLGGSGVAGD